MAEFGDPRLPEHFWAKVSPEPNSGCWLWTGCVNARGYGRFGVYHQGTHLAHRHAYAVLVASPGEFFVCHRCDTPACCNPAHLFLGEHQDNVADMVAKGRHKSGPGFIANAQKTHCWRGHPLEGARIYRGSRVCRVCCAENRRIQRRKARGISR